MRIPENTGEDEREREREKEMMNAVASRLLRSFWGNPNNKKELTQANV